MFGFWENVLFPLNFKIHVCRVICFVLSISFWYLQGCGYISYFISEIGNMVCSLSHSLYFLCQSYSRFGILLNFPKNQLFVLSILFLYCFSLFNFLDFYSIISFLLIAFCLLCSSVFLVIEVETQMIDFNFFLFSNWFQYYKFLSGPCFICVSQCQYVVFSFSIS